jgi:hypothetical protein
MGTISLLEGIDLLTLAHINLGIERAPWGKKRVAIRILASPIWLQLQLFLCIQVQVNFFMRGGGRGGPKFYFIFQKGENLVFSWFLVTKFGNFSLKLPNYSSR